MVKQNIVNINDTPPSIMPIKHPQKQGGDKMTEQKNCDTCYHGPYDQKHSCDKTPCCFCSRTPKPRNYGDHWQPRPKV